MLNSSGSDPRSTWLQAFHEPTPTRLQKDRTYSKSSAYVRQNGSIAALKSAAVFSVEPSTVIVRSALSYEKGRRKQMPKKDKTTIVADAANGIGAGVTNTFIELSVPTPARSRHLWAVVMAGGDGTRLRDLTVRIVGDDRPKQFCPIVGAQSLLRQTRARLHPLFSGDRQVFVVSCAHERYYSKELADASYSLVIAQPINRGTAVGIIIALVQVMQADPDAIVGFYPCDHHYSDDESFRSIVRSATSSVEQFPRSLVTLGAEAEYANSLFSGATRRDRTGDLLITNQPLYQLS